MSGSAGGTSFIPGCVSDPLGQLEEPVALIQHSAFIFRGNFNMQYRRGPRCWAPEGKASMYKALIIKLILMMKLYQFTHFNLQAIERNL